jgi:hypothetical protein
MALKFSFLLLTFYWAAIAVGQSAAGPAIDSATLPSAMLQPSLDVVKQALDGVRLDKWKGPVAVRSEADANLASIRKDVETTLPPLLAAADAAPDSAAKTLPAYRNVEALYDVLLRVAAAGKVAAPGDQSSALDQALVRLDDGRRALGDRLQVDAKAQEKRVVDLQAALKAVPPPAPPPPPPVACPTPPVKKKKVVKPAPAAASQSPATPSH